MTFCKGLIFFIYLSNYCEHLRYLILKQHNLKYTLKCSNRHCKVLILTIPDLEKFSKRTGFKPVNKQ